MRLFDAHGWCPLGTTLFCVKLTPLKTVCIITHSTLKTGHNVVAYRTHTDPYRRHNLFLTEAQWSKAKYLGGGNASRGIRWLIDQATEQQESATPNQLARLVPGVHP